MANHLLLAKLSIQHSIHPLDEMAQPIKMKKVHQQLKSPLLSYITKAALTHFPLQPTNGVP
jgi:hypothetical protein